MAKDGLPAAIGATDITDTHGLIACGNRVGHELTRKTTKKIQSHGSTPIDTDGEKSYEW